MLVLSYRVYRLPLRRIFTDTFPNTRSHLSRSMKFRSTYCTVVAKAGTIRYVYQSGFLCALQPLQNPSSIFYMQYVCNKYTNEDFVESIQVSIVFFFNELPASKLGHGTGFDDL